MKNLTWNGFGYGHPTMKKLITLAGILVALTSSASAVPMVTETHHFWGIDPLYYLEATLTVRYDPSLLEYTSSEPDALLVTAADLSSARLTFKGWLAEEGQWEYGNDFGPLSGLVIDHGVSQWPTLSYELWGAIDGTFYPKNFSFGFARTSDRYGFQIGYEDEVFFGLVDFPASASGGGLFFGHDITRKVPDGGSSAILMLGSLAGLAAVGRVARRRN